MMEMVVVGMVVEWRRVNGLNSKNKVAKEKNKQIGKRIRERE
jgi:hypothetical protein